MSQNVVTSVPEPTPISSSLHFNNQKSSSSSSDHQHHNNSNNIRLELRNQRFTIDREALMELPESILLCLFPNGVVLSQKPDQSRSKHQRKNKNSRQSPKSNDQNQANNNNQTSSSSSSSSSSSPSNRNQISSGGGAGGGGLEAEETDETDDNDDDDDGDGSEEEEVYYVDFDGPCLTYILKYFYDARLSYYGTAIRPQESPPLMNKPNSPLFYRQAIIVLREELEYFSIPSDQGQKIAKMDEEEKDSHLNMLKRACGGLLLENKSVFTALQRNVNREKNVAEQHLIDMLCMTGFSREDDWGYRSLEPKRCCITSLALVLLKTGIKHTHPEGAEITGPETSSNASPEVDSNQLTTAQKLLLFWRKPARKCWWDSTDLSVNLSETETCQVKLWARRVWTLELSLI